MVNPAHPTCWGKKIPFHTTGGGGLICWVFNMFFFVEKDQLVELVELILRIFLLRRWDLVTFLELGRTHPCWSGGSSLQLTFSCNIWSKEVLRASFGGWKMRQKPTFGTLDDFWQLRVWVKNSLVGSILLKNSGCHLLIFCQLEGGQNNPWPRVVCGSTQFLFFSLVKNSRARKKKYHLAANKKKREAKGKTMWRKKKTCGIFEGANSFF